MLKAGESLDFTVGDKTLTIEPVPYGNIKKIMRIAFEAQKDLAGASMSSLPELIDKNLFAIFPLMFRAGKYDFLTPEWIENTMTVPTLRKMLEAGLTVNGLEDFFGKAVRKTPTDSPAIPATPPAKDGSTISAALPTDGGPKT